MKKLRPYLFLLLIGSRAMHSSAQIVNIESSRMQSDTVGWMGKIGAAASLAQNTDKIFHANLEAHLQYKTSNDMGLWLVLGNFGFLQRKKIIVLSNDSDQQNSRN